MGRKAFIAAALAWAAVLLGCAPANASTQSGGWRIAPVEWNHRAGGGDALSCVTPNWCMSVGPDGTQIWDGQQWSSAQSGKWDFSITALSCSSTWECMLVGYANGDVQQPVAFHWVGHAWVELTPPVQLPDENAFTDVSCPGSSFCVFVGNLDNRALLWQGGTWTSLPFSLPTNADVMRLGSIDCPAVNNCTATAQVHVIGTPAGVMQTVFGHWSGDLWYAGRVLTEGRGPLSLGAISCTTTTSCVAVGRDDEGMVSVSWGDQAPLTVTPVPDSPNKNDQAEQEPDGFEMLTDISCWAPDGCQAVGITNTAPFHRIWDGAIWTSVANPPPTDTVSTTEEASYDVKDIDCYSASFCLTAGAVTYGTLLTQTYFEQYRG